MQYLQLMRLSDWVKNLLVLAPAAFWFSSPLNEGRFPLSQVLTNALIALAGFCFLSSAVYAVNDALDEDEDRRHPVKRLRPVAAGKIPAHRAVLFGCSLVALAFGLASMVSSGLMAVFSLYLLLQIFYNACSKFLLVLDVITISLGFVLRAAAGAVAIDIGISTWLLLCVFFLCLYLGFIKRLCDLTSAGESKGEDWTSRAGYGDASELDWLLGVSGAMCLMMYLTYTLSDHTRALFGVRSTGLALLSPLVLIVIHRFYRRAHEGRSDSPMAAAAKDVPLKVGALLFAIGTLAILYLPAVERVLSTLVPSTAPAN